MLSATQWGLVFPKLIVNATSVVVLGGPNDRMIGEELVQLGRQILPETLWFTACNGRSLRESVELLAGCSRLIAIDSSMLHFARLFGVPTVSFWGPTDPTTRLREIEGSSDRIWYQKLPCSPCVHIAQSLPCGGKNICIEAAVRQARGEGAADIQQALSRFEFLRIDCR